MAGGAGTRLWPMSRTAAPKQFQKLLGDRTLIQQTFDRITKTVPAEQIWVVTSDQHVKVVKEQLPKVLPKHIIAEPTARNTAPATLLALMAVLDEDPEAVLFGLLPADHYIGKERVFTAVTESAFQYIEKNPEAVVTIGIRPNEPNTGLGYIKVGERLARERGREVLSVEAFTEKPDLETTQAFVESGEYLWNGGYYLFNGAAMLKHFENLAPKIFVAVKSYFAKNANAYSKAPAISLDVAIAEKLKSLAVVPAEMEWSDIGNWATLHEILASQGKNSEVVTGDHIGEHPENSLVLGGNKLIATVGVKDIVVIDTDDVILICHKESVQDVKKIVEQLQKQNRSEFL